MQLLELVLVLRLVQQEPRALRLRVREQRGLQALREPQGLLVLQEVREH